MLKTTKNLKDLAMVCIAEMQKNGLTEIQMKEPKGFFVTSESIKGRECMPLEKIEVKGKYYLICHK